MIKNIVRVGASSLLAFMVLAGCTVGPDFQKPQVDMPEHYISSKSAPLFAETEKELVNWWEVFDDSVLVSLVEKAVEGNLDLKLAEARILQTRAARGKARSEIGPTVKVTGSFSQSQSQSSADASSVSDFSTEEKTEGGVTGYYFSGFDSDWELDFFGGVRRGIEAADADLEVSIESRHDVLVTLIAEVVRNYIELRMYQQRVAVSRQNLEAQQGIAKLTWKRFLAGFESRLDVTNAEALAAATAAEIPLLEVSAKQAIYNIGVLTGNRPGAFIQELSSVSNIPLISSSVPVGVPSELLRRRPDIRKAEAEIHAETARIGVAVADLYPKFTITGSAGTLSNAVSSLFSPVDIVWSLGSSISTHLFSSGKVESKIDEQKALKKQAVIRYQQAVLSALQEVENAMVALKKEDERRRALEKVVETKRRALQLAERLYQEGFTDYISVLETQRSAYESDDAFVQSTGILSTNLVSLFKALGGGWNYQVSKVISNQTGSTRR